jgi:hypothetical protein
MKHEYTKSKDSFWDADNFFAFGQSVVAEHYSFPSSLCPAESCAGG